MSNDVLRYGKHGPFFLQKSRNNLKILDTGGVTSKFQAEDPQTLDVTVECLVVMAASRNPPVRYFKLISALLISQQYSERSTG
jgi:hypothetical protein